MLRVFLMPMLEMPETNCSGRQTLSPLAILQWNCHSLSSKLDVATSLFAGYDVLALSETWLTVDSRFLLHDFNVFRKDSPPRFGGGLILAVRSSLTYSYIEDTFSIENKLDTQAIIIHFENLELSIISIYRNPNSPAPFLGKTITLFLRFANPFPTPSW